MNTSTLKQEIKTKITVHKQLINRAIVCSINTVITVQHV